MEIREYFTGLFGIIGRFPFRGIEELVDFCTLIPIKEKVIRAPMD